MALAHTAGRDLGLKLVNLSLVAGRRGGTAKADALDKGQTFEW
jgi:hypothetical protein